MADLSTSPLKAVRLLTQLREYNWVDYYTRAVFLEFTVYNPNVNMFAYVNYVFEFPPIGGVLPYPRVMSFEVRGCLCVVLIHSSLTSGPPRFEPSGVDLFQKGKCPANVLPTYPASAANWLIKVCVMCYHVYVRMHVKEP